MGELNVYAVLKNDNCGTRYVETAENHLLFVQFVDFASHEDRQQGGENAVSESVLKGRDFKPRLK